MKLNNILRGVKQAVGRLDREISESSWSQDRKARNILRMIEAEDVEGVQSLEDEAIQLRHISTISLNFLDFLVTRASLDLGKSRELLVALWPKIQLQTGASVCPNLRWHVGEETLEYPCLFLEFISSHPEPCIPLAQFPAQFRQSDVRLWKKLLRGTTKHDIEDIVLSGLEENPEQALEAAITICDYTRDLSTLELVKASIEPKSLNEYLEEFSIQDRFLRFSHPTESMRSIPGIGLVEVGRWAVYFRKDPDEYDHEGQTVFHRFVSEVNRVFWGAGHRFPIGHKGSSTYPIATLRAVVGALVDIGADVNAVTADEFKLTPLDLAENRGDTKTARVISSFGGTTADNLRSKPAD